MSTKQPTKKRTKKPQLTARSIWSGTKRVGSGTAKAYTVVRQRTTQIWCVYCQPAHYVRKPEWPLHYQWAMTQARERRAAAQKATRALDGARTAARAPAPPPTRPVNNTKQQQHRRAAPMTSTETGTTTGTAAEAILEAFRAVTMIPPGSLLEERRVAEQMAEVFTGIADAYRRLVERRFETGIAEAVLEPYLQIARNASKCADLHMEVSANAHRRYGTLADELARRDVPVAYVAAGR